MDFKNLVNDQDGGMENPSLHPPTRINNDTAISEQKQLYRSSGVLLGSTVKLNSREELRKKRKRMVSWCLHHPIPQQNYSVARGETPVGKRPPLSVSNKLPQVLGHRLKNVLWFHPTHTSEAEIHREGQEQGRKHRGCPPKPGTGRAAVPSDFCK